MRYATKLDIGRKKRSQNGINEDSLATSTFEFGHRDDVRTAGVFVLADGAGGHADGDVASYIATNRVMRRLTSFVLETVEGQPDPVGVAAATDIGADRPTETEVLGAIEDAIDDANRALVEYANDAGANPATTVVAAILLGDTLYYGWVGDSRIYLVNRAEERISLLTRDHSKVERMRELGEIDDVEAHVHQEGNVIMRALQGSPMESPEMASIEVDTGTAPVYRDDLLFLTSDGLVDAFVTAPQLHRQLRQARQMGDESMVAEVRDEILEKSVTDEEIRNELLAHLGQEGDLDAAVARLVDLANERGGKDNLSLILVDELSTMDQPSRLPPRGIDEEAEPDTLSELNTIIESDDAEPAEADSTGVMVNRVRRTAEQAVSKASETMKGGLDEGATESTADPTATESGESGGQPSGENATAPAGEPDDDAPDSDPTPQDDE